MRLWPVIERELRVQARAPGTYWMRWWAASTLLVGGFYLVSWPSRVAGTNGDSVFLMLHWVMLASVCVLVPLITADSISRERREGTLGLLFLTPLKAWDVVLAKAAANGLRGATAVLAALPVMSIPLLMGGVGGLQVLTVFLIVASVFCWVLGVSVMVSASCEQWHRSLVWAALLIGLGLWAYGVVVGMVSLSWFRGWHYAIRDVEDWTRRGWELILRLDYNTIPGRFRIAPGFARDWIWMWIGVLGLSVLVFWGAVWRASRVLSKVVRWEPPSAARQQWEAHLFSPRLWKHAYRKWLAWKLDRNPVGWLQQRTWQARLVTWSWLAVLMSIYSTLFTGQNWSLLARDLNFLAIQSALGLCLMISVAFTSAGSFRRERVLGIMELLLVSPLGEGRIIWGRLRAIWGQFLPAACLYAGIHFWWFHGPQHSMASMITGVGVDGIDSWWMIFYFLVSYGSIAVIGLYFSMRMQFYLSSVSWTVVAGILLPELMRVLLLVIIESPYVAEPSARAFVQDAVPLLTRLGTAIFGLILLIKALQERRHVLAS